MSTRRQQLEELVQRQDERYGPVLEDLVDDLTGPTGDTLPPEKTFPIVQLTWSYEVTPGALAAVLESNGGDSLQVDHEGVADISGRDDGNFGSVDITGLPDADYNAVAGAVLNASATGKPQ